LSENKKKGCFGLEHGLKRACKFCPDNATCGKAFWELITTDGKHE